MEKVNLPNGKNEESHYKYGYSIEAAPLSIQTGIHLSLSRSKPTVLGPVSQSVSDLAWT